MRLDGDHTGEPCHLVVLHYNHYGRTTIGEAECCTDQTRHEADGDSPLQVRSARQETDEERREREEREARQRAEQEARLAAELQQFTRLTEGLAALPDEAVIAAVLRRAAREELRRHSFEDPLLPMDEEVVGPDEQWMFPSQIIDAAPLGDLAQAVARQLLVQTERGGYYSARRSMRPIVALGESLPELPDAGEDEAEAEVA
ncbi:MAG: hypothetical protein OXS29_13425 [bacterium]|nr:hypothetical protein [bacterium]MDE0287545.1 hypothetical protein [bacterium]MDE0437682.1 hypothetical protein [bacterium]